MGGGGGSTGKNAVAGQCLLARTLLVDQFRRQRNERVVNKINRRGGRKRNSSSKNQIEMGGLGRKDRGQWRRSRRYSETRLNVKGQDTGMMEPFFFFYFSPFFFSSFLFFLLLLFKVLIRSARYKPV